MYCNLPGLEAREGQRVRFYYMSLGTDVDLHTPSLAGASQVPPPPPQIDLVSLNHLSKMEPLLLVCN